MRSTRVRDRRPRGRRGVSMVLVAMLLFFIMGVAGVAIDFSRLYTFKTQLQTSADAGAMAGALELVKSRPAGATDTARKYSAFNQVEQVTPPQISPSCLEWDIAAGTVKTPGLTCTDPKVNAVRVEVSYPAAYTLARVFGPQTQTVNAAAIAARGYVGSASCLKPWAVNYQTMLDTLFGVGVKNAATYSLTAADVQMIGSQQKYIAFALDNSQSISGGNIQQVQVGNPWSGNQSYKAAIVNDCAVANMMIGPGTWLDALPGAGSGQTTGSVAQLCGIQGNPQSFTCNVPITMAIWDQCRLNGGGTCVNGANLQYRVKYVGAFVLTFYSKGNGPPTTAIGQVGGYFTSMAGTGTFSGTPSPLAGKAILVQ